MDDLILKRKMQLVVSDISEQEMQDQQDAVLFFILEGTMHLVVENKEILLNPNDLFVVNSNFSYSFNASPDILFVNIPILYYLIGSLCNGISSSFLCDSTTIDNYSIIELRKIVTKLLFISDYLKNNIKDYEYISTYYQLLQFLADNFIFRCDSVYQMQYDTKDEQRRIEIDSYIKINYDRNITLDQLSSHLYLSKNYLSRYFSKIYGMSFSKYIMQVRLNNTIDELIYSDKSVTKIAYDNGFESISMFNRSFKERFGKTPSQFRKSIPQKGITEKVQSDNSQGIIQRLQQYQNHSKKDYTNALSYKNHFSVENVEETKSIWNKLINIGEACELLNGGIQEHVMILRQAFHFEYCRFWNIFSEELSIVGSENYNFTKIDRILDFILSMGLKPFIDLEQKPKRINKTIHHTILIKSRNILFDSKEIWIKTFTTLITHFEKRYGQDEVSSWILEIGQCRFYDSSLSDELYFFELFNDAYSIVKRHIPKMKVGGSCEAEAFRIGSRDHFFILWKQQICQPDFVSCMDFEYDTKGLTVLYSRRSLDQHHLLHHVEKLRKEMDGAGLEAVPIYVTEWNLTVSDRNIINDACYKGAYIVKSFIDTFGKIEMLGYYLGSDRNSEYSDSNELAHGGLGLLTVDGIPKPAVFAFEFLNELMPLCIGRGSNFLISGNGQNQYKIVCHNIKSLNYNYYITDEEKIDKRNLQKYFDETDDNQLKLNLQGIKNGKYQVKISRINPQSGSLLTIWKELGYSIEFSRKDIKYFRSVCEPRLSICFYDVEDGILPLSIDMLTNEIALIAVEESL